MFPMTLRLCGRLVLLVGAGRVGRRKLDKILRQGANVWVVEPEPDEYVRELAESGRIELTANFTPERLTGVSLAFTASKDSLLNQAVAKEARKRGIWINMADDPDSSDFILPALVERGDFCLAVSTGGASPALTAKVAGRLRTLFGPEYEAVTRLLAEIRPLILNSGLPAEQRETIFKRLAESDKILAALTRGDETYARRLAAELMAPLEPGDEFISDTTLTNQPPPVRRL